MIYEEFNDIIAINLGFADKDDLMDHTITMADFPDNAVYLSLRNDEFLVWTAKEPSVGMIFQSRSEAIVYAKELIAQEKEAAKFPAGSKTDYSHKATAFTSPRQSR